MPKIRVLKKYSPIKPWLIKLLSRLPTMNLRRIAQQKVGFAETKLLTWECFSYSDYHISYKFMDE